MKVTCSMSVATVATAAALCSVNFAHGFVVPSLQIISHDRKFHLLQSSFHSNGLVVNSIGSNNDRLNMISVSRPKFRFPRVSNVCIEMNSLRLDAD